jgi:Xaa-Pro aminopeptidase
MPTASKPRPQISIDEFRERQNRARELCAARGWPGLALFGRGGGTYDRHGDVLYLTGHYQSFVYLPDRPPLWSGRSHTLLVLPVEGEPVLLCSAPDVDRELAVDDVRVTSDFIADASPLLDWVAGGGLVGGDVVPYSLARELPLDSLAPADDLLDHLRRRKSPAEHRMLAHACEIGSRAVSSVMDTSLPGATEGEAFAAAAAVAYADGAVIYLPILSSGDRVASYTGRPLPGYRSERRFAEGDLVRLDLVLVYEGYYSDFGRSWVCGGSGIDSQADALIAAVHDGLEAALAVIEPGISAGVIARAGTAAILSPFSLAYPPHWGHGLGLGWEGPILLAENEEPIEEGMALAVEVTVNGDRGLAASGEENVIVRAGGPELLTSSLWPSTADA